jgi:hypothetical protein
VVVGVVVLLVGQEELVLEALDRFQTSLGHRLLVLVVVLVLLLLSLTT